MNKNTVKNFCAKIESSLVFALMIVLVSGCSSHKNMTNSVDAVIYDNDSVTTKAEFPGGQGAFRRYFNNNFEYPYHAIMQHQEGPAVYSFVIDQKGSVRDVQVIRSVGYSIDKTVINLLKKMPKWTPATLNGKPVCVKIEDYRQFRLTVKSSSGKEIDYDTPALFPGGYKALESILIGHSDVEVSGTVKVSFIVDEKGDVVNPRVVKSLNNRADKEALNLVRSLPRWTPAMKNNKPIRTNKTVSIYFPND